MSEPVARAFLGKQASVLERTEVYVRPEGFEVEDRSLITLRRSWILFDEVTLVTFYAARAWSGAVLAGFFALIFVAMGGFMAAIDENTQEVGWFFVAFGVLFGMVGIVSFLIPRWTVTIQGLRSRARMVSPFREAMQGLYEETVRRVTEGRGNRPPGPATEIPPPPEPPVIAYEPV